MEAPRIAGLVDEVHSVGMNLEYDQNLNIVASSTAATKLRHWRACAQCAGGRMRRKKRVRLQFV